MKETVIYKKESGFAIQADFYGIDKKDCPVVVYIHGGGFIWGSRKDVPHDFLQLCHDHGYAVFSIDYRLAPETKLDKILEDIRDALTWLQTEEARRYSINSGRIAVMGASAGGFLALSTGILPNRPRAIVSFYGYGDISSSWAADPNSFYQKSQLISWEDIENLASSEMITEGPVHPRYLLYLHGRQHGTWTKQVTGFDPFAQSHLLKELSPLYRLKEDFPPALLVHGTKDTDVPYEQSVFMKAAILKEKGQASLITVPGAGHDFEKHSPKPVIDDVYRQVFQFINSYLKN
ncbi:alpha/beta hydrolase [Bacillus sp. FJAT-27225]|nr:alpha/beta hydrolase [Bacillus sp. FJAT-27225]